MSICWNCYKKNNCERLYLDGEQKECKDRDNAYKSNKAFVKWLAKHCDFNYRRENE